MDLGGMTEVMPCYESIHGTASKAGC